MGFFKDIKYGRMLAKLENAQKLAVIRLWLEIIEADGSTSRDELAVLPDIKPAEFKACRELSFQEAIDKAKMLPGNVRHMLLDLSEKIGSSDGVVAPSEQKVIDAIKSEVADC